ncbi:MAG: hypothetical protein H5U20_04060 [Rhodobacteraceae bacterium]|nr:hypothetical protein [Paracoccaceae bacterium]
MRITVSCPEALIGPANQLAMVLGEGPADAATFRAVGWRDAAGNVWALASFEAGEEWLVGAQAPLQRPAWDVDGTIDMEQARQAQERLLIWSPLDDTAPPALSLSDIGVTIVPSGAEAALFPGFAVAATGIDVVDAP